VADIMTPNRFELEQLTGTRIECRDGAVTAARALLARGPRLVAVTGLAPPAVEEGCIGTLAVAGDGATLVVTPRLAFTSPPNGAGDAFAALFLGHLLARTTPARALSLAVSGLFAVLDRAAKQGLREMPLVEAQDVLVDPPFIFPEEPIRP